MEGLALLTDVEAVFTKPPHLPDAKRIPVMLPGMTIEEGMKSTMGCLSDTAREQSII